MNQPTKTEMRAEMDRLEAENAELKEIKGGTPAFFVVGRLKAIIRSNDPAAIKRMAQEALDRL